MSWVPLVLAVLLAWELLVVPGWLEAARELKSFDAAHLGVTKEERSVDDLERLLDGEDSFYPELDRDYAMTWAVTQALGAERQREYLDATDDYADAAIGNFLLRYQVRSPDLEAIRVYFDALEHRRERTTD